MANLKIALEIWLSKKILFRSVKTALVVGTILAFINHGNDLLNLSVTADTWARMILTFFVPYTVSSLTATQVILADLKKEY